MKRSELRDELEIIIRDTGFTAEQLNSYINQAIQFAATQVELPQLKVVDVVATVPGQSFVTLSSVGGGFNGILRKVWDKDRNPLLTKPNLESFLDEYAHDWDAVGDVKTVVLEGGNLWYWRSPESPQQLTLLYYRMPRLLLEDDDSPDDFPVHLHRELFVHGAAWKVFDIMEDGIEGQKVNARSHRWHSFDENNRDSGIVKLREWIGKRRNHYISSVWRH